MLRLEKLDLKTVPWNEIHAGLEDRTIFQSHAWLDFLERTQRGEPVLAALRNASSTAGYFTGMIVRKFGLKILGSPFPGWSTSYMGFNLQPGVSKQEALDALKQFAFRDLECAHLEFMDRKLSSDEISGAGFEWKPLNGYEIDLTAAETDIFDGFDPACRRAIRKATRMGVTIEETRDDGFDEEYYAQLEDVFAKQQLVPTYPITRVQELMRSVDRENLLLLRARSREGRSIATGIFLRISPTTMYFWGGASWRADQNLRPNDLLMWVAMRLGKEKGIAILDMGGSGSYKEKFGGRAIAVPWARISSRPFIPLLRNTAKTIFKLKQRVQGKRASRLTLVATPALSQSNSKDVSES